MVQFFRTNRPVVFFNLLLFTAIIRGAYLLFPGIIQPQRDSFLGPFIIEWIQEQHIPPLAVAITDSLLIYIEAILLNLTLTSNNIFDRYSYVPALVFITLSSLFGEWVMADIQTVAQLFLIVSMFNLFSLSGQELGREKLFYTALFVSIASFFYFPSALFLLVILFGIMLRGYGALDFMLLVIGFVLPFYFIGILHHFAGHLDTYYDFFQGLIRPAEFKTLDINPGQLGMLVYVFFLALYGFFEFRSDREFNIVKQKRLVFILLGYLFLSVFATSVITSSKLNYLQTIALPATIFVAKIFDRDRLHIARQILFILLIAGALFFQLWELHII